MKEALKLALEVLEDAEHYGVDAKIKAAKAIRLIKETLEHPEQRAQLLFEVDGEMLTASQMMGVELFNFQQATGCDTAAEFLAQPEQDCTRSHPHEEMSKECELRTEIARLRNQLAQRTWVGLTPDEIRGISLAFGESLFSAIMFTHDKLKEKNT